MESNKKIERYLDERLRNAEVHKVHGDFTSAVMIKIREENELARNEAKSNKIAKFIIGGFSLMVIFGTILIGLVSGSSSSSKMSTRFSIEPALESTNDYFYKFFSFIGDVFYKVLELFGLSATPQFISIFAGLIIAASLFMIADRLFIRGKLKSR